MFNGDQLFKTLGAVWVKEKLKRAGGTPVKLTYGLWLSFVGAVSIVDHESQEWYKGYRKRLEDYPALRNDSPVLQEVLDVIPVDVEMGACHLLRELAVEMTTEHRKACRTTVYSTEMLMVIHFDTLEEFFKVTE